MADKKINMTLGQGSTLDSSDLFPSKQVYNICNSRSDELDLKTLAKSIGQHPDVFQQLQLSADQVISIQLFEKIVNHLHSQIQLGSTLKEEVRKMGCFSKALLQSQTDRDVLIQALATDKNEASQWFDLEWKALFGDETIINKHQFVEYLANIQTKFWDKDKQILEEQSEDIIQNKFNQDPQNAQLHKDEVFQKMKVNKEFSTYLHAFGCNNWSNRKVVVDMVSVCSKCQQTGTDGLFLNQLHHHHNHRAVFNQCFDCVQKGNNSEADVQTTNVPSELMQEVHYLTQKNQPQTQWPQYTCSFNNYFEGYWNQTSRKPTFRHREIDEDYPYGIMPRWKHIKVKEVQQGKLLNNTFINPQQIGTKPTFFWIFPFKLLIFSTIEKNQQSYHIFLKDQKFRLVTGDFEKWVQQNNHYHYPRIETHPLLIFDQASQCVSFGENQELKILIHEKIEESDNKIYQLLPASNPFYCHSSRSFLMEYSLIREHIGGVVTSKWTLQLEWTNDTPMSIKVVEHELIIGKQFSLYPTLVDNEALLSGGFRLGEQECEIPKLKPHEFLVQSPLMLGSVRQFKFQHHSCHSNHLTDIHLLVLTSRLTDKAITSKYSQELTTYHHQKMLWNCTKNLLNGVPDNSLSILGSKSANLDRNKKGLLQPHYMLDCMSKLHFSICLNNLQDYIDEELLFKEREETILDLYLSQNQHLYEQITETIERLKLNVKPHQIMLDLCFSHPVIDTCNFEHSCKTKIMRNIVIEYLLRNNDCSSHIDLMCSLIGFVMEPENCMETGMLFFQNIMQESGDKMSNLVQELLFSEQQLKSMNQNTKSQMLRIPFPKPNEHIKDLIVNISQKETDSKNEPADETEQQYYFFDLNKAFLAYKLQKLKLKTIQQHTLTSRQIKDKLENYIYNKFNGSKDSEQQEINELEDETEPRVFKSFKQDGFLDDLDVAKFLEQASELSQTSLQDMEILKIMIHHQFQYTQKIQYYFFIMYFFGYFVPINWQMNLNEEENPNCWVFGQLMLISCFFTQTVLLLIEVSQAATLDDYLKYPNNYIDMFQIALFYVYFVKRMNFKYSIIPDTKGFEPTDYQWVFWNNFMSVTSFFKLLLYIRMWEFMLNMIVLLYKVTSQLVPFILFVLMLDLQVAYMYHLTGVTVKFNEWWVDGPEGKMFDDYPDINKFGALFIQQLRNSMGDISAFNYHNYWLQKENVFVTYYIWLIFIVAQIITMLIFMNFVIAKINDTYIDTVTYKETMILQMQIDLNIETQVFLKFFKCGKQKQKKDFNFCFLILKPNETEKSVRNKSAEIIQFAIKNSYLKAKENNLELHRTLNNRILEVEQRMTQNIETSLNQTNLKIEESNRKMEETLNKKFEENNKQFAENLKLIQIQMSIKPQRQQSPPDISQTQNQEKILKLISKSLKFIEMKYSELNMSQNENLESQCHQETKELQDNMQRLIESNKKIGQSIKRLELKMEAQESKASDINTTSYQKVDLDKWQVNPIVKTEPPLKYQNLKLNLAYSRHTRQNNSVIQFTTPYKEHKLQSEHKRSVSQEIIHKSQNSADKGLR